MVFCDQCDIDLEKYADDFQYTCIGCEEIFCDCCWQSQEVVELDPRVTDIDSDDDVCSSCILVSNEEVKDSLK